MAMKIGMSPSQLKHFSVEMINLFRNHQVSIFPFIYMHLELPAISQRAIFW